MMATLEYLFSVGCALFVGSIVTFIVVSALAARSSALADLVFARTIVRTATLAVTVPGMWLAVAARAAMLWQREPHWAHSSLQLAVLGLIVSLTHLLIVPATRRCLLLARRSLADGQLQSAYRSAYLQESVPGAINLVLALTFPLVSN